MAGGRPGNRGSTAVLGMCAKCLSRSLMARYICQVKGRRPICCGFCDLGLSRISSGRDSWTEGNPPWFKPPPPFSLQDVYSLLQIPVWVPLFLTLGICFSHTVARKAVFSVAQTEFEFAILLPQPSKQLGSIRGLSHQHWLAVPEPLGGRGLPHLCDVRAL